MHTHRHTILPVSQSSSNCTICSTRRTHAKHLFCNSTHKLAFAALGENCICVASTAHEVLPLAEDFSQLLHLWVPPQPPQLPPAGHPGPPVFPIIFLTLLLPCLPLSIPVALTCTPRVSQSSHFILHIIVFFIFKRFSCQLARFVLQTSCSQRLPQSCPLLDSPDPSKTKSTVGTKLSICTAPCQPGSLVVHSATAPFQDLGSVHIKQPMDSCTFQQM